MLKCADSGIDVTITCTKFTLGDVRYHMQIVDGAIQYTRMQYCLCPML